MTLLRTATLLALTAINFTAARAAVPSVVYVAPYHGSMAYFEGAYELYLNGPALRHGFWDFTYETSGVWATSWGNNDFAGVWGYALFLEKDYVYSDGRTVPCAFGSYSVRPPCHMAAQLITLSMPYNAGEKVLFAPPSLVPEPGRFALVPAVAFCAGGVLLARRRAGIRNPTVPQRT